MDVDDDDDAYFDNWVADEVSQKIIEEFIKDSLILSLGYFFPIRLTGPTDGKL